MFKDKNTLILNTGKRFALLLKMMKNIIPTIQKEWNKDNSHDETIINATFDGTWAICKHQFCSSQTSGVCI
jgi:hypothetical protein